MSISRTLRSLGLVGAVLAGVAACDSGPKSCAGILGPERSLSASPQTVTLDVGGTATITGTFTTTCADDSKSVSWASDAAGVATVVGNAAGGATVTAVGPGTATLTATAAGPTTQRVSVTVRPLVPTTITLSIKNDTLSPLGTRAVTATVRDQRGVALPGAGVSWRSLNTNLATVSNSGVVTAVANGTARIVATAQRVGTDSISDTLTTLIVAPCTLVRPITLGTSYSGSFDVSSCKQFLGFPGNVAQFAITTTAQTSYSVSLTPGLTSSLVPLNIGAAFYGIRPADSTVTGMVVTKPGTFGFIVASVTGNSGTYTVNTALNPDPLTNCLGTDITRGVSFQSGLTPSCQQRDIRILPVLNANGRIIVTARALSFPARIDLLNFADNSTLAVSQATVNGGTATINYLSPVNRFVYLRIYGGPVVNERISITVDDQ